mgnify:CR=1 FL=1
MIANYEMVIGLEVHVELKTATKIFCGCSTKFGAAPNTQCCPVCTGMPGSLPVLNGKVVEYAVKAGLATGCKIATYSKQDRKNYFYPDLPRSPSMTCPCAARAIWTLRRKTGRSALALPGSISRRMRASWCIRRAREPLSTATAAACP